MNLILDIGNTQTVFGFYDDNYSCIGDFRLDSDINYKPEYLCRILTRKMQEFELEKVNTCIIASVVPRLTSHYQGCIRELIEVDPYLVTHSSYKSLKFHYYDIAQLGIDRLCNVAAVKHLYCKSVIVIDFGTAITFEIVDQEGAFAGGLILPGIRLNSEALAGKTALLPKVELSFPARIIGRSTEECIRSGIMNGTAELCRGMIKQIKAELELEDMSVVATGGYAHLFAAVLPEIGEVIPDLVPKGALAIYNADRPAV